MWLINQLTSEQKALIPVYLEKWRKVVLSTQKISQKQAVEIVESVYSLVGKPIPEIIFCNSPDTAINKMFFISSEQAPLENNIVGDIEAAIEQQLEELLRHPSLQSSSCVEQQDLLNAVVNLDALEDELDPIPENNLDVWRIILGLNQSELVWQFWCKKVDTTAISAFDWYYAAATFDSLLSQLDCYYDSQVYQLVEKVVRAGVIMFPFEEYCFVCDRPTKLSCDNQNRLHAEGAPAIQFADGYSLYFYHGVTLPERYAKVHPNQWQSQWLLTETNAELRRVLIQGIGYSRICEQLQASELDSWGEYTLLQIDDPIDVEPICLLKMTCPSTGFIHVLRVPPDINSAREAIRWVNWGIDPEDFAVQT